MGRGSGGGYSDDKAPWRFEGRALYQLNLVKSSEARKHVPADLKLVELFGYTLGGIYLARYAGSPAGTFDEMVALGGLVWNAPTSCAWAARVFVNSDDARSHGVKVCGLPSHFARFEEDGAREGAGASHGWWKNVRRPKGKFLGMFDDKNSAEKASKKNDGGGGGGGGKSVGSIRLRDVKGVELCTLALPPAAPSLPGPRIKMALPSFSGRTDHCPHLLKYSLAGRGNGGNYCMKPFTCTHYILFLSLNSACLPSPPRPPPDFFVSSPPLRGSNYLRRCSYLPQSSATQRQVKVCAKCDQKKKKTSELDDARTPLTSRTFAPTCD